MNNITIGRYKSHEGVVTKAHIKDNAEVRYEVTQEYTGWVEGVREDGSSWILWLDENASPILYFSQREPNGAVIGLPIELP